MERESAEPTRALNPTEMAARPNAPGLNLPDAPASARPAAPLEPTQALAVPPASPPLTAAESHVSADALLADETRRRRLESELARMGLSVEEVRRLLTADATDTDPLAKTAAHAASAPPPVALAGRSAPAPVTSQSLQSVAAERMSANLAARVKALDAISLGLPDFRESSPAETRQSEGLLREASMLRRRERFKEAEAKCREALALVPKDAAALELLGDLFQGVARVDEALAAYKRATLADPRRSSAERKYGDLLMRQQNWNVADPEAIPKNSFAAVLLSALLPGAGQLHNGEWGKGAFFLAATLVCVYLLAYSPWGFQGGHRHGGLNMSLMACIIVASLLYLAGLIDANMGAKQGDRRGGAGKSGWDV